MAKTKVSPQLNEQAVALAKANQRPGQTKAQTKLIEEGIRKGIAQYKKQQKALARERDKAYKAKQKQQYHSDESLADYSQSVENNTSKSGRLPWILLIISWCLFAGYGYVFH